MLLKILLKILLIILFLIFSITNANNNMKIYKEKEKINQKKILYNLEKYLILLQQENNRKKKKKEFIKKTNIFSKYKNDKFMKVKIYIKDNLNNCVGITQLLNNKVPFVIVDSNFYNIKKIKHCFNIWGFNYEKYKNKIIKSNDFKKISIIKKYFLKKKNTYFKIYDNKIRDLLYLYNIVYNKNIPLYLNNNYIQLNYDEFKQVVKLKYKYNFLIKDFVKKYNKLLKENNIKQNILEGWTKGTPFDIKIKSDGVKCGVYTSTLYYIFTDYLINTLILKENTDYLFTYKHFKKVFNEIDNYRYKNNKKLHYYGLYDNDIINYFTNIYFYIGNKEYYTYKVFNNFNLYYFIYINVGKNLQHLGFRICDLDNNCYNYFPDDGKITKNKNKLFLGKKRKIYKGITISIQTKKGLTF